NGPLNGTLAPNSDGSFIYTPAASFKGTDSFTYKANDGQLESNVATVTITVTGNDRAPAATNDVFNTPNNTALTIPAPGVLGNDTDPDRDAITVSTAVTTQPGHGTVSLLANGSFTYTPANGFSGADS